MMLLFSKIKSRNQFTANAAKVANVVADKIYKMMLLFNKKVPKLFTAAAAMVPSVVTVATVATIKIYKIVLIFNIRKISKLIYRRCRDGSQCHDRRDSQKL